MTATRLTHLLLHRATGFAITGVIVGLIALAAFQSVALPLVGARPIVVRGGSMEPTIPLGSLIAVSTTDLATVRVGDVVTAEERPGLLVTHRIIERRATPDGDVLVLKGDANATPDPEPVPLTLVRGRLVLSLPFLGWLVALLSLPSGWLTLVSTLGWLWLAGMACPCHEDADGEATDDSQPAADAVALA